MESIENFRRLILRVARFARNNCANSAAIHRLLHSSWQPRVRLLSSHENLQRQFRMLLSMCTFREIARLFRIFFRQNNLAIEAAGSFVASRDMQHLHVLRGLMAEYDDIMSWRNIANASNEEEEEDEELSSADESDHALANQPGSSRPELIILDSDSEASHYSPSNSSMANNGGESHESRAMDIEEVGTSESCISDSEDDNDDSLIARRGGTRCRLARNLFLNYAEPFEATMDAVWQVRAPSAAESTDHAQSVISTGVEAESVGSSHLPVNPNIPSTSGEADRVERAAMMHQFYTRSASVNERSFHLLTDHNRLTFHAFDDQSVLDRRVNELIRREENGSDELLRFDSGVLTTYVERIRHVPRAQQLRWFHSMAENRESDFYTGEDISDILSRARDGLNGPPEE